MNPDDDTRDLPPLEPAPRPWSIDSDATRPEPTWTTWDRPPDDDWPPYTPVPPAPSAAPAGPRRSWAAVAVVAALIGALFGAGGYAVADRIDGDEPARSAVNTDRTPGRPSATFTGEPLDLKAVLEKVQPAVVSIGVSGLEGRGAGTGMILTPDGEVLTNAHVVNGATRIRVTLFGENESRDADLIGGDAGADLAIVKIRNASGLPTVELGSSQAAEVGDDVVAIGNALALPGGPTVTTGIISAKDRSLEGLDGLIQTDTAINQGNSGGPLVNAAAQVIGVNTAVIRGGAEGIGFSIAIDNAKPVIDDLRAGRAATSGAFLGVSSQSMTPTIAENLDVPVDSGAVIVEVVPDSAADGAGLQRGDVIVEIDGQRVDSAANVGSIIRDRQPGDEVEIVYYRGAERRTAKATLGSRPATSE